MDANKSIRFQPQYGVDVYVYIYSLCSIYTVFSLTQKKKQLMYRVMMFFFLSILGDLSLIFYGFFTTLFFRFLVLNQIGLVDRFFIRVRYMCSIPS